jgi:elongation factor P hydroxylase
MSLSCDLYICHSGLISVSCAFCPVIVREYRSEDMKTDNPDQLIELFDELFVHTCNTRLDYCESENQQEPIYLPADAQCPQNRILFAHGFFASALHEISHWCIAGAERRKLIDYGYWYEPDGRSAQQQREFETVEAKPQAIEWILTKACGRKFNISTDNLNGTESEISAGREAFAKNVLTHVKKYLKSGLPQRADVLKQALLDYYQVHKEFTSDHFQLNELISVHELPIAATI